MVLRSDAQNYHVKEFSIKNHTHTTRDENQMYTFEWFNIVFDISKI